MVVSTADVTLHDRNRYHNLDLIRSFVRAGVSAFIRIQGKKFSFRISNHTFLCENSSTLQKISNRKTHYNKEYTTLFVGKMHVKKRKT